MKENRIDVKPIPWLDFCHSSANVGFYQENPLTAAKEVFVHY